MELHKLTFAIFIVSTVMGVIKIKYICWRNILVCQLLGCNALFCLFFVALF